MKNKMSDVRNLMIEAMESLLDEESTLDVQKAKTIASLGSVLVKSAKAEVDFIKATGVVPDQATYFIGQDSKQLSE